MKKRRAKSARRRRSTPRTAATTRRRKASPATVLRTVLLGTPMELIYKHADGGTYSHKFNKSTRVSYTADGRALVIDGSNVKAFIEG